MSWQTRRKKKGPYPRPRKAFPWQLPATSKSHATIQSTKKCYSRDSRYGKISLKPIGCSKLTYSTKKAVSLCMTKKYRKCSINPNQTKFLEKSKVRVVRTFNKRVSFVVVVGKEFKGISTSAVTPPANCQLICFSPQTSQERNSEMQRQKINWLTLCQPWVSCISFHLSSHQQRHNFEQNMSRTEQQRRKFCLPAAAAWVPVRNPSHSVRPGSFRCTWLWSENHEMGQAPTKHSHNKWEQLSRSIFIAQALACLLSENTVLESSGRNLKLRTWKTEGSYTSISPGMMTALL